ncbi:Dyp-type peroxidase [Leucobacter chinensis]|uniref:Dyp-type peroxidase n=1 Tax=Leucobacter chinensis TaxID=2851010 RepID=UPI001C23179B|nr:Dyp-type peroxidase [Leucobacter chinensis]
MTSLSRRALLGTTLAGVSAPAVLAASSRPLFAGGTPEERLFGEELVSATGPHQAGITTAPTAHLRYLAFTLKKSTDAAALERMFRILTADIEALTEGRSPLADTEPELAELPAFLTVTVGVGPELVKRVSSATVPEWLGPLPAFEHDELSPDYEGGDLVLQLASDDPTTLAHAARMLLKSVRTFADPHWRQDGFRRARGTEPEHRTMRNLMGQVDGTTNPSPEDDDFDELVWVADGWLAGGTAMVFRRIRMELETWDRVDRRAREEAMGRDLAVGAPLTGEEEFDEPDWEAKDSLGFHVIPNYAHIRRARSEDPKERIYRRAVNYDDGDEQGLLFVCFQADPLKQFVPIQKRLDELDIMNEWITHVGSAVFAVLPGWKPGGMLGETLLKA